MHMYGMLLISECHGSLSWFDGDYGLLVAYYNIILQVVVSGLDNKIFRRYKVHCCRCEIRGVELS
jgi:hypothetical protein